MRPNVSTELSESAPRNNTRRLLIAAGILVLVVALYLGISYLAITASLTPHPLACAAQTPNDEEFSPERVRFRSDGDAVPLVGWLLPSSGVRAIVLVHGLDSNSWDGDQPDMVRSYVQAGFHVLAFDLRGHGGSGGDRLGLGWDERRDVRAAVDLLLGRGFKPGTIGVHGTSYGAATALLAAAAIPEIGAVVADSAFADMRDIMERQIEKRSGVPSWVTRIFLRPGFAFVARHRYGLDFDAIPPERAVPDIAPRSILFIHGSDDPVIPVEHARRLKAASRNPADELWLLPRREHTEGVLLMGSPCETREPSPMREAYLHRVTTFFERSLRYPSRDWPLSGQSGH